MEPTAGVALDRASERRHKQFVRSDDRQLMTEEIPPRNSKRHARSFLGRWWGGSGKNIAPRQQRLKDLLGLLQRQAMERCMLSQFHYEGIDLGRCHGALLAMFWR
jgi:hypothetical protein